MGRLHDAAMALAEVEARLATVNAAMAREDDAAANAALAVRKAKADLEALELWAALAIRLDLAADALVPVRSAVGYFDRGDDA